MKKLFAVLVLSLFLACSNSSFGEDAAPEPPKELNAYLDAPDDSFQWTVVEQTNTATENSFLVELTSQTWHGIPWKHFLVIVVPNKITNPKHALMYIAGGSIGKKPRDGDKFLVRSLAQASGMCTALLLQVPNQPLLGNYYEDALIGETLLKAIETKDTTWPLLFPMAKSAVKAMDAVQQVLQKEKQFSIDGFIVAGASKRGWTTWLTAASGDKRVVAIAPTVIDTLNIRQQMKYQIETWGDFSPSIHDYTDRKLVQLDESQATEFEKKLWTMIDPYSYRARLAMPKLLIHGTNDPYWAVDASQHYFGDLSGTKYILTLPNTGHGLDGQQLKAAQTLAVFAKHAARGNDWPTVNWKLDEDADAYRVKVETDLPLRGAKLWTATSETKDFRAAKWASQSLEPGTNLDAAVKKPASGHVAFFVELESADEALAFSLTTRVWRF